MFKVKLSNLDTTKKFAILISTIIDKGCVVLLKGELGIGKTTFSKFFIDALVPGSNVTSPTFCLVNVYEGKKFEVWHYDLYRITHPEEIYELGIEEALKSGVAIIEWPEIIENIIPNNKVIISLSRMQDSEIREAEISLVGEISERAEIIQKFITEND